MAKSNILEWDATASNNTDINNIGVQGSNNVNNFDNAFRELMAQGASNLVSRFTSRAAGYTAVKADHNQVSLFTASATLGLTAAATLTNGWEHTVIASGGDVTIDPNASETINGLTTIIVLNGQRAVIRCDGTAFYASVTGEATIGAAIQGHLYGLTLSNNGSDATNDIDIAIGSAASDGTTPVLMTLASALTKRLDAAWAVGTNQGGLDTGAIANTGYHIWLIQRSDTGVVDALFSTSATAPTMPTNYDRKRRIGWIQRAAATITPFRQNGNRFMLATLQQQYAQSGVVNITQLLGTVGPSGIRYRPIVQSVMSMSAASTAIAALGDGDAAAVQANVQWVAGSGNDVAIEDAFYTNTNTQVRHSVTTTAGTVTSYALNSIGWIDDRGML
jgi:hypothetical protein